MERLTIKRDEKNVFQSMYYAECKEYADGCGVISCPFDCPCEIEQALFDRLGAIEEILGDDYDLDRLRELVESDRDGRIFITLPYEEEEGPSVNDPVGPEGEPGVLDRKWYKRAGELMEADRDGRCVVLPCKVGDIVYLITEPENVAGLDLEEFGDDEAEKKMVFECKVGPTTIYGKESQTHVRLYHNGEFVAHYIQPVDFGKCVFLTREAAEAALKGDKHGENQH